MVPGLFHRVILLSGSAYSSWALVEDPVIYALKLAKEVNCTIPEDLIKSHEQIVDCLREVPLDELYATEMQAPNFLTAFGPSVSYCFYFGKWKALRAVTDGPPLSITHNHLLIEFSSSGGRRCHSQWALTTRCR